MSQMWMPIERSWQRTISLIAAVAVLAVTAAAVALVVYRVRAERAMLAAWHAQKAAAR